MTDSALPSVPFKERDHSRITTVVQLRNALVHAGMDPDHHIIWDEDRKVVPTFGVYVATLLDDGNFSLVVRDRGNVNDRGTYATEGDLVRAFLAEADPEPPPDQARVRAAMQRDYIEKKAWRDELKEKNRQMIERVLRERATAGLPLDPTIEEESRPEEE